MAWIASYKVADRFFLFKSHVETECLLVFACSGRFSRCGLWRSGSRRFWWSVGRIRTAVWAWRVLVICVCLWVNAPHTSVSSVITVTDWCVSVWQEYIPTVFTPKRSSDGLHQDLMVQCERMDLPSLSYLPTEVRSEFKTYSNMKRASRVNLGRCL